MCGIAGYLRPNDWQNAEKSKETLIQMAAAISSRGPDDFGVWQNETGSVGLAHRRLSVVDLSPAGHQPMISSSGRYVMVYNGEIYNHAEIRKELQNAGIAPAWRGNSDTESILAGFDTWGVQKTLQRCAGMFAFALWDREHSTLTLGRDRMGEKPLYYGWVDSPGGLSLVFGSEIKSLKQYDEFAGRIDRGSLCLFLRHNYIPAPYSIYENVQKLEPGNTITFDRNSWVRSPEPESYWSFASVARNGLANMSGASDQEIVDELESSLRKIVRQQMVADVPLGAFLSGGIDSSTVVALMQAEVGRPVKTFTIGFTESGFNEAVYAKEVADHLGTDHTELYLSSKDALSVIPKLSHIYDEPFSDSSQIPTLLVSQLARRDVTVSLSGDGGDELFCGYTRYTLAARLWNRLQMIPQPLRKAMAAGIAAISPDAWDKIAGLVPIKGSALRSMRIGDRLHKASNVLSSQTIGNLYLGLVSHWQDPEDIVLNSKEHPTHLRGKSDAFQDFGAVERMMALDTVTYLPDDIMAKVDRAAMSVSLETRVPFLDHRLVEFAWTLPPRVKMRDGQGKWALRQVLYRHVPQSLIDRPKMGFGVPLAEWLRGPLKPWAEELLDPAALARDGYFDASKIREKWLEHCTGSRNWAYLLWDVLMFQAWLKNEKN